MTLNSTRVNLLLDKLCEDIKSNAIDLFHHASLNTRCELELGKAHSDGDIESVSFKHRNVDRSLKSCIKVEYRTWNSEKIFKITLQTDKKIVNGDHNIRFKIFSFTWWKWKKLLRVIKKSTDNIKEIERQVRQSEFNEKFNDVYADMFPEEIDKILLGSDDQ